MIVERYFEDYTVGETTLTSGRTITEADIVLHAGQTGDFFHLRRGIGVHRNQRTRFTQRIQNLGRARRKADNFFNFFRHRNRVSRAIHHRSFRAGADGEHYRAQHKQNRHQLFHVCFSLIMFLSLRHRLSSRSAKNQAVRKPVFWLRNLRAAFPAFLPARRAESPVAHRHVLLSVTAAVSAGDFHSVPSGNVPPFAHTSPFGSPL